MLASKSAANDASGNDTCIVCHGNMPGAQLRLEGNEAAQCRQVDLGKPKSSGESLFGKLYDEKCSVVSSVNI